MQLRRKCKTKQKNLSRGRNEYKNINFNTILLADGIHKKYIYYTHSNKYQCNTAEKYTLSEKKSI